MGAIDITKPLEMADGTPVTFDRPAVLTTGGYIINCPKHREGAGRLFDADGRRSYGELPPLRNVQPAMPQEDAFALPPAPIGHNGGPPLDHVPWEEPTCTCGPNTGCTNCPSDRTAGDAQSRPVPTTAPDFLRRGADLLDERGRAYDNGAERSMARIVRTFNALTGHELSEVQGWMFMQTLKNVRLLTGSGFHRDSAEDCIAYAALAAEAAASAA